MTLRARLHWLLFASYVALFFTLPLTLLWGWSGMKVGGLLALGFLIYLGFRGSDRILARLKAKPLARAEAPILFGLADEYARRLGLPLPRIALIETNAVNTAAFAFSRN